MAKTIDAVGKLRIYVEGAGTQAEAARRLSISTTYLSDLLNSKRTPSDSILEKIGLCRIVVKI
tara:strand:- start:2605 stop:2793 length:189 start_codon:yes stop_codon:yes gene_type:complete